MNFKALQDKVIEKLKERSTPKYWPISEIKDNINLGCKKFAADTKCKELTVMLTALDVYNAYFKFPAGLIKNLGVFWKGKQLVQTTRDYLDDFFSGYSDAQRIGSPSVAGASWREMVADAPTNWLTENGKVKLFPVPQVIKNAPCRFTQTTVLRANETEIILSQPIPVDKNLVDLYLNGVYQNKDQWNIIFGDTIEMVGAKTRDQVAEIVWISAATRSIQKITLAAGETDIVLPTAIPTDQAYVDLSLNGRYQNLNAWSIINPNLIRVAASMTRDQEAEISFYPGAPVAGFSIIKKTFTLEAGEDTVSLPVSYTPGTNAVAVRLDSLSQAPSTFTETDQRTIKLSAPVTRTKSVEVSIYKFNGFECTLSGVFTPAPMINDTDTPDIPDHLEYYHDALWLWALFECYSREGQGKDSSLAELYLSRYQRVVSEYQQANEAPIEYTPRMPFRL